MSETLTPKPLPDQKTLLEMFRYDAETGELYWRERPPHHFRLSEQITKATNTRFAGKVAGFINPTTGYKMVLLGRKNRTVHRIVWKMVHGIEANVIDHINGVITDNRLCNLRSVNRSENQKNTRLYRTNKSGASGVYKPPGAKSWQAFIKAGGKRIHLGSFPTFAEAKSAREAANVKYGYHENHGIPLTSLPEPRT